MKAEVSKICAQTTSSNLANSPFLLGINKQHYTAHKMKALHNTLASLCEVSFIAKVSNGQGAPQNPMGIKEKLLRILWDHPQVHLQYCTIPGGTLSVNNAFEQSSAIESRQFYLYKPSITLKKALSSSCLR